jgi:hypothetical protein
MTRHPGSAVTPKDLETFRTLFSQTLGYTCARVDAAVGTGRYAARTWPPSRRDATRDKAFDAQAAVDATREFFAMTEVEHGSV